MSLTVGLASSSRQLIVWMIRIQRVDISAVDLNLLVALDALLTERSVTRAGRRIGLSQPAMSAALARLRALFADPLFVRTRAGMLPTQRALAIASPLQDVLANVRVVLATPAFDPAVARVSFQIVTGDYGELVILPALLAALEKRAPRATLRVRPITDPKAQLAQLGEGVIDLVIAPMLHAGGGIEVADLFHEDFVCVLRRSHPARPARLTLRSFARLRHLLVSPEGDGPALVDEVLGKAGLSREIALRIPHFLVAPALVATSDMVATLPRRVVAGSAMKRQLTTFAPPFETRTFTMVVAWHARRLEEPAVRWFRDLVVEIAGTL
jgi:DNA-binding transcriptional LysR family regulator